jgi:hypothetical protein
MFSNDFICVAAEVVLCMESPAPSINISASTNDGEVDEALHELLDSRLVPISANKTSPVWQYFAMVKDGPSRATKSSTFIVACYA